MSVVNCWYDIVMAGFPGTMIAVSVEVSEKDEDKIEWLDMAAKVRRGVYVIQKIVKRQMILYRIVIRISEKQRPESNHVTCKLRHASLSATPMLRVDFLVGTG
jgi:hypothetical protein